MKSTSYLKFPLFFILLLSFIILGFIISNKINKTDPTSTKNQPLSANQIAKIKSNMIIISSTPTMSSNPYDQIKAHKNEYNEIIAMGEPVVDYFLKEFKNSNLNGSNEWISAWICNKILGDKNPIKIWVEDNENGWDSGRDWYEKYT
ncbi:MAG: hypothetical protein ACOH2C_19990, partial [Clostridium sp.]